MEKLLIEAAYQKYSGRMLQAMIRFSRDEAAARDAVSQAFTQALMNQTLLETMPEPAVRAWLYAAARNALGGHEEKRGKSDSCTGAAGNRGSAGRTQRTVSW